jgi:putative permease
MIRIIQSWFNRYFSDPEAVLLVVLIGVGMFLVLFMGHILAPVIISVVFAYLLEWIVKALEKQGLSRLPAVLLVYAGFLTFFALLFLVLLPTLWKQIALLLSDLPTLAAKAHAPLDSLSQQFPEYFSEKQVNTLLQSIIQTAKNWGSTVLFASISSIPGILTWVVYMVLIPLLVFFFLKDRALILSWLTGFLPEKRSLVREISVEVNTQIGNYCWGKMIEILLTWLVSYIIFSLLGLKYAIVLTFLLGLSSLIPYVGVAVVTFPFACVAYLQWGWGIELVYVMSAYFVIQALLGSVIEPLLFSEALNLHPVAIILATLVFGGFWGFWGVFFAIPLATLVKAVLNAWPKDGYLSQAQ